jgi:pyruvate kinase
MADLQGPKIRIGKFAAGPVQIKAGQEFILMRPVPGRRGRVGLDYPDLVNDVRSGDVLLLDDGRTVFDVLQVQGKEIRCRNRHDGDAVQQQGHQQAGRRTDRAGADRQGHGGHPHRGEPGHRLCRSVLSQVGRRHAPGARAAQCRRFEGCWWPRSSASKPSRTSTTSSKPTDGVMVARGDLAVEVGDAAVPALQKRIIRTAREFNKFAITATQMMESMIHSPVPTRAEVSDVANAVLDGTDAVMLSAETATGDYPVQTVEAMSRICVEAEKSSDFPLDTHFLNRVFTRIDQSIAMAALFTAHHLKVKAIASLTESGSTALWMSRLNTGIPILCPDPGSSHTLQGQHFQGSVSRDGAAERPRPGPGAARCRGGVLIAAGAVEVGDLIVLTIGEPIGKPGGTNTMKIVKVGEHRSNH